MTNEDKLRELVERCRPHVAHLADLRRDEGQNNDSMYMLMEIDELLKYTAAPQTGADPKVMAFAEDIAQRLRSNGRWIDAHNVLRLARGEDVDNPAPPIEDDEIKDDEDES